MRVLLLGFCIGVAVSLAFAGGAARPTTAAVRSVEPRAEPSAPMALPTPSGAAVGTDATTSQPSAPACTPAPLAQRAALTLVTGLPDVTDPGAPLVAELVELGVGASFLTGSNVTDPAQARTLAHALSARGGLVATDEEWGRVSSFRELIGATSSPRTIAGTRAPAEVRADARALGAQLDELGIDWDFAPVADLDTGPSDGVIGDRSFSSEPGVATRYARAFASGLSAAGVIPTVKHFPGHGSATGDDPHSGGVRSDVGPAELARELGVFRRLIDADVPAVMVGHVTYPALGRRPASMSGWAYDRLRELGFDGVAITDSVGMGAVHNRWDFGPAAVEALKAGADAVLVTDGTQARTMRAHLVAAVRSGELSERRLNAAAMRMLRLAGRDTSLICPAS